MHWTKREGDIGREKKIVKDRKCHKTGLDSRTQKKLRHKSEAMAERGRHERDTLHAHEGGVGGWVGRGASTRYICPCHTRLSRIEGPSS